MALFDAVMQQAYEAIIVSIMACRLFDVKPLSETMLKYC